MKDIPIDSPFYSFHEWREKINKSKVDVWLGLYLARKFDVKFVVRPDFSYDHKTVIVSTYECRDLDELETYFEGRVIALYEIFQHPSVWEFSQIDPTAFVVTPLDSPRLKSGYFTVRACILKEIDDTSF